MSCRDPRGQGIATGNIASLPGFKPYVWRAGDREREAEIATRLDAIRVRAATTPAPAPPPPPARPRRQRCPECLFMTDTDTHRIVCGSVT